MGAPPLRRRHDRVTETSSSSSGERRARRRAGIDVARNRAGAFRPQPWSQHAHSSRTAPSQRRASPRREETRRARNTRDHQGRRDAPAQGGGARASRKRTSARARSGSGSRRTALELACVRLRGDELERGAGRRQPDRSSVPAAASSPGHRRRAGPCRRRRRGAPARCERQPWRPRPCPATKAPPPWVASRPSSERGT